MTDKLSPERRSRNMAAIRSKNMKPEMIVRKLVHSIGFRYRLHRKDLPGKPDLVFGPRKKVIFVHGCFWHQHPDPNCKDSRLPKSRLDYWVPKLERNQRRDAQVQEELQGLGWTCLTIWECETKQIEALKKKVLKFLRPY
ncbi:very short patch repair endonuclease [Roseibium sp. RKSG952]|uniref:very short patch repair endonuclease n=1 Tax=Roseibium sp. RKSG952 TaxID=2529384 RepID=UPI0012BB77DF|nr:very short patch repair endonuclease [Roseibium sp. RKSG952]MTH95658.1 DNA mismatch endonuclease Vsr [Roseibium sp. RKSG952]